MTPSQFEVWLKVDMSQQKILAFNPNLGGGLIPPPSAGFPLITQKQQKLQPWHFAAFSKILLETLVPNLVFFTSPSLQTLGKTQMRVFWISGWSLIKRNCHYSLTSDHIDTKFGQVTKLDKRNLATSKKLMKMSCWKFVTSLSFFKFTAN